MKSGLRRSRALLLLTGILPLLACTDVAAGWQGQSPPAAHQIAPAANAKSMQSDQSTAVAPHAEVVPLSKLRRHLLSGTPVVDPLARARQVALRWIPPLLR